MFYKVNGYEIPRLCLVDTYKLTHPSMYNKYNAFDGVSNLHGYIAPRKGHPAGYIVSAGIEYHIEQLINSPLTFDEIEHTRVFAENKGWAFDAKLWTEMCNDHKGRFPLKIIGVPDGIAVSNKQPMLCLTATDEKYFWLVPFFMDTLLRIWYTCEVATSCLAHKELIRDYLYKTTDLSFDNIDGNVLPFMFHNFGSRACPTTEQSMLGGIIHSNYFSGTDNTDSAYALRGKKEMGSIDAMEHNMVLSAGVDNEYQLLHDSIKDHLINGKMYSILFDTFDVEKCLNYLATLKDDMVEWWKQGECCGKVIFRNDSGDPVQAPVDLVEWMLETYGYTKNSKGYKLLPEHLGAMQGDGTDYGIIGSILESLDAKGVSTLNIAFGQGGQLMNGFGRDDRSWSAKISNRTVDGIDEPVSKKASGKKTLEGFFKLDEYGNVYSSDSFNDMGFYVVYYEC